VLSHVRLGGSSSARSPTAARPARVGRDPAPLSLRGLPSLQRDNDALHGVSKGIFADATWAAANTIALVQT